MGRSQKRKGYRNEKQIEKLLQGNHLDVIRIPLSGATNFKKGDLLLRVQDREYTIEVKARKEGFTEILNGLIKNDGLYFEHEGRIYQIEHIADFIKRMQKGGELPKQPFGTRIRTNKTLVGFFKDSNIVIVKVDYETPFVVYQI